MINKSWLVLWGIHFPQLKHALLLHSHSRTECIKKIDLKINFKPHSLSSYIEFSKTFQAQNVPLLNRNPVIFILIWRTPQKHPKFQNLSKSSLFQSDSIRLWLTVFSQFFKPGVQLFSKRPMTAFSENCDSRMQLHSSLKGVLWWSILGYSHVISGHSFDWSVRVK